MNRRSFLAALGLSPVVATTAALPLSGEEIAVRGINTGDLTPNEYLLKVLEDSDLPHDVPFQIEAVEQSGTYRVRMMIDDVTWGTVWEGKLAYGSA